MTLRLLASSIVLMLAPLFANATAVAPAMVDLSGARGQTIEGAFQIINIGDAGQSYFLGTLGFRPREESGEPSFFPQKIDGLMDWIQFPVSTVRVSAQSKVDVPFLIVIPADVASGSYHAAITVSQAPAEIVQTNGAVIEAMTAVLVFLNIEGETNRGAALLDFTIQPQKKILWQFPESVDYRLQNQGNVQFIPNGSVKMVDVFGRTVMEQDANATKGRVLPNTTRKFTVSVLPSSNRLIDQVRAQATSFAIGPVTVELNLNPGEGFDQITSRQTIWYIPVYFLSCVVLVLLALVVLFHFTHKKFSP